MKIFSAGKMLLLFLILFSAYTFPQSEKNHSLMLTGNLKTDSKISLNKFENEKLVTASFQMADRKSPIKASLFSAILPGAGQFYNGDYLLSAVFAVVEATVIAVAVIYNNKGNQKTDEFQNFADQHWNVKRYAQWTLNNLQHLNPSLNKNDYPVFDNNGNVIWSELNKLETAIGDGYSHNLPRHGEQQYYELIGKYPQYSHGWDDSNQNDTDFHILSTRFLNYSDQRGEANDLYKVSTRAVAGIYINHILSALEAAWGASRFNKNLSMNMRIRQLNFADKTEFIPTMNFRYNF
jgi:hypothetical protein